MHVETHTDVVSPVRGKTTLKAKRKAVFPHKELGPVPRAPAVRRLNECYQCGGGRSSDTQPKDISRINTIIRMVLESLREHESMLAQAFEQVAKEQPKLGKAFALKQIFYMYATREEITAGDVRGATWRRRSARLTDILQSPAYMDKTFSHICKMIAAEEGVNYITIYLAFTGTSAQITPDICEVIYARFPRLGLN